MLYTCCRTTHAQMVVSFSRARCRRRRQGDVSVSVAAQESWRQQYWWRSPDAECTQRLWRRWRRFIAITTWTLPPVVDARLGPGRRLGASTAPGGGQADRALCGFLSDPLSADDGRQFNGTSAVRRGRHGRTTTSTRAAQSSTSAAMRRRRLLCTAPVLRQLHRIELYRHSRTHRILRQLLLRLMQKSAACSHCDRNYYSDVPLPEHILTVEFN